MPHPFLIDPLNCPFKVDEEYCLTPGCVKAAAVVLNMYDSTVVRTRKLLYSLVNICTRMYLAKSQSFFFN